MKPDRTDYQPLEWLGDRVRILDQTRLPWEEVYLEIRDSHEMAAAIKELKVRGAPTIGIAGAYGVAVGALRIKTNNRDQFLKELDEVIDLIGATRPTARNLFIALERLRKVIGLERKTPDIKRAIIDEAKKIHEEEIQASRRIGLAGADLIENGATILTHCNTGPLATGRYGTALGVIIEAYRQRKKINVFATETRPLLQGARLTAWELQKAGIPFNLITDSMAGYFMKLGKIDGVITGADRIAANGDTANKIGTYTLAVLAGEHKIPFYIAAPVSTIDPSLKTGGEITVEQRAPEEVTHLNGVRITPEGIAAANPAFDVTPGRYITALITDQGVLHPPYMAKIHRLFSNSRKRRP
jgi:methylthioribose-1-phosphate isomerase